MRDKEAIKNKVLSGFFWKIMERGGVQGIQFLVQIVLARLLIPEDFGVVALITIFISVANVFVQSGFSTALIQKKDADSTDFSSVFYLTLSVASLLYFVSFITAPFIADFYREPKLTSIIHLLMITLFFGAVNSIQNAFVSKAMQFKCFFFSSLGGIIPSGIISIIMAYMGYGVWALVWQQIINQLLITLILWNTVKWRPTLTFSTVRIKTLFSFSWKILFSALLDTTYTNLFGLVIGKTYSSGMLAFYNQGNMIPSLIVTNINGSVGSVMLPALSANQDDILRVKAMMRRSIMTSSFIIFPMMVGVAVCAVPLVKIVLTDKWLPCVPFLQLMCLTYAFWPIHTANLQAINALGRSDIFLKLEIVKKIIGLTILAISIPFGIYIMVAFQPITSFLFTIINSYPNQKLLNYSFKEQWKDIIPFLFLSIFVGIIVYIIQFIVENVWICLLIQLIAGLALYLGIAYLLNFECFTYLINIIKLFLKKRD